jgi:8-oxo-dGTP diphosphatase
MDYIDTADAVLFAYDSRRTLRVLTILRRWEPFQGRLALPGGHIDPGEKPRAAAARELHEETGVRVPAHLLKDGGVYDQAGRDPRGHYRTFAFTTVLTSMPTPVAADDAAAAEWTPVAAIRAATDSMAFDHRAIVLDAASRLGLIRAI